MKVLLQTFLRVAFFSACFLCLVPHKAHRGPHLAAFYSGAQVLYFTTVSLQSSFQGKCPIIDYIVVLHLSPTWNRGN